MSFYKGARVVLIIFKFANNELQGWAKNGGPSNLDLLQIFVMKYN